MHPLLTWTLALEHFLGRPLVVVIVGLPTDAVELISWITVVDGFTALVRHESRPIFVLFSHKVDALGCPVHVLIFVNFIVLRWLRFFRERKIHWVYFGELDCVEIQGLAARLLLLWKAVPRFSMRASRSLLTIIVLLKLKQDRFVKIFSNSFNSRPMLVIKLRG
jgi:hypothetical protein